MSFEAHCIIKNLVQYSDNEYFNYANRDLADYLNEIYDEMVEKGYSHNSKLPFCY